MFGANEVDQIIRANYLEVLTKHDIKIVSQFFRLKLGDTFNIVQFEMEYERAVELIAYKSYNAFLCLNAMNLSLFSFAKHQIQTFEREILKAKTECDRLLDSKRVKGNQYESINYQSYLKIVTEMNPTLQDEDIAKAFGSSIGMAINREIIQ